MQSSAHATLMQFANVLQESLFPVLTENFGSMSPGTF